MALIRVAAMATTVVAQGSVLLSALRALQDKIASLEASHTALRTERVRSSKRFSNSCFRRSACSGSIWASVGSSEF